MSEVKQEIYKNKGSRFIYIVTFFFVLILFLTLSLYFYNSHLDNKISNLEDEISQKEVSIKSKKDNKLIQIYNLYTLNKVALDRLEKYSKITKYIDHLSEISSVYNLNFSWFNYSAWVLNTKVTSISDERWIDYQKTANFIKSYRNDTNVLFTLDFINKITSQDDRQEFDVTFELR